jgi:hypothetical protein
VGTKPRRFSGFLSQLSEDDQPEKCLQPFCRRCRVDHHCCSPRKGPASFDVTASMSRLVLRPRFKAKSEFLRYCGAVEGCMLWSAARMTVAERSRYDEMVGMPLLRKHILHREPAHIQELPSSLSLVRLIAFPHLYLESAWYGEGPPSDRLARWAAVVGVCEGFDGLETLIVIRLISGRTLSYLRPSGLAVGASVAGS